MNKDTDESKVSRSSTIATIPDIPISNEDHLEYQQQYQISEELLSSNNLQPFDWLTSSLSLESLLRPILSSNLSNLVLHVGCGSSTLGEMLIEEKMYNVSTVVNVDIDTSTLRRMQKRWENKVEQSRRTNEVLDEKAMQFVAADFTIPNSLQHYYNNDSNVSKFDMVLDKSTLDCMLCTDSGAVGLLLETYRCLKENGGVYLIISFHSSDFMKPLLENLPGAHWDVVCTSRRRQIEQLNNVSPATTGAAKYGSDTLLSENTTTNNALTWSSGTFQPDEHYVKNVTVITCRRRLPTSSDIKSVTSDELDWDQVYEHVHRISNEWYQQTNPMLTKERVQTIERAFTSEAGAANILLDLEQCYPILFTDGERENLSYEDFLDDWQSFLSKYSPKGEDSNEIIPSDRMSFTTAIAFLHVMQ